MMAASNGDRDGTRALSSPGVIVYAVGWVGAARPTGAPARVTPPRRAAWSDGAHGGSRALSSGKTTRSRSSISAPLFAPSPDVAWACATHLACDPFQVVAKAVETKQRCL